MADRIGLMPLMRFAKVAKARVDSADLAGLAAMYDLLEQCIAESDWDRFEAHADKSRADGDDLMAVVGRVFEVLTERPTSRPSDSSDGPATTSAKSEGGSSGEALVASLEAEGRPSWALMARQMDSRSA